MTEALERPADMRLTFERDLPFPIEVAWDLLTDPMGHNRWSAAQMTVVRMGDGASPASVGTRRRVALRAFGIRVRLHEEIVGSDPPRRLTYRVVGGIPLRRHLGEIALSPRGRDGRSTRLTWTIEMSFRIPGQALAARLLLRRQLGASVDALAELRPPDAAGELGRLVAAARRALEDQRRLAAELAAEGDPKQWFARVYAHVSEAQIERCRSGAFEDPAWVLRVLTRFHTYYAANLEAWRGGHQAQVEEHWRAAFLAVEAGLAARDHLAGGITRGLVEAIRAHVDGDLPRTLAEVYLFHYASARHYQEFAPDYARMNEIFPAVQRSLLERMPALTRLIVGPLPRPLQVALASWVTYDVAARRLRAFARGGQIAVLTTLLGPYRAQTLTDVLVPALATPSAPQIAPGPAAPPPATLVAGRDPTELYDRLHALLEAAELHRSRRLSRRPVTIAIEGAGAAPLAAEIALALRRLLSVDYPRLGPGVGRVIVTGGDQALATVPVALRPLARALMGHFGVELLSAPAAKLGDLGPGEPDHADLVVGAPIGFGGLRFAFALATASRRAARRLHRAQRPAGQRGVRWAEFVPGQTIVRQGDPGDSLYVIERGEAEVLADRGEGERLVVDLRAGDHFGERAVFKDQPRSATVRARTAVRALVIERVHALTLGRAVPAFGDSIRRLPAVERER